MFKQPLSNIRVLDLTHFISGPYCTKLLADYGAEVIKVEPPWGEGGRRLKPFLQDEVHLEKSGLFLYLNTNKKGITLNLKCETGKRIFLRLLEEAHILVENFEPRVMGSLGLDYPTLERINSKLVMVSISNFGQTGPYRDYKGSELVLSAIGAATTAQGFPGREPLKLAGTIMQFQAGQVAAVATLLAYYTARTKGIGQHVDVAIIETMLNSMDRRSIFLLGTAYRGDVAYGVPETDAGFGNGAIPCKDGYIFIVGGPRFYRNFCRLLGPDLLREDDPRFCTREAQEQPENYEKFTEILLSWTMKHTMKEITEKGQANGLLVTPMNTMADFFEDDHSKARKNFVEIEHRVAGKFLYPGGPINDLWFQIKNPAPLLGEHNEVIYGKLGYSKEDLVNLRELGIV